MSQFNVNQNHPLIPSSNSYVIEKKYVSIHSEDRDISKFPLSSLFEIELPQDYKNVQSIRLNSWSFPANYNVFSGENNNLFLLFSLKDVYNPSDHGVTDPLQLAIYQALTDKQNQGTELSRVYIARIAVGFYNPDQMGAELTNSMNNIVSLWITDYFKTNPQYTYLLDIFPGYNEFSVVYNSVGQKLWFGNGSSVFVIDNSSGVYFAENIKFSGSCVVDPRELPSYVNWGLPAFLGFTRISQESTPVNSESEYKFNYGDVFTKGDNGVWIKSNLQGATVSYLVPPAKINFMGPAYFYMELSSDVNLNCIDETSPYNVSKFTETTNQTNGIVNSSFAKIAIPTTPISQWFDTDSSPYAWFNPPAEKIRKIKIKLRYHNGQLIQFGLFEYSFMLEFSLVHPAIQTNMNKNIPYYFNSFG